MSIFQNIFKRKDVKKVTEAQKRAIEEANKISNEEAIENVKRESLYYRKAKAVEKIVQDILKKHQIMEPPLLITYDSELQRAKAILDIKGLSMPDTQSEEIVITKEDIKAGLYRAWVGVNGLLEYYEFPQESIDKNGEIFKKLIENEIPVEYESDLEPSSNYFAKRYAVPKLIYNPFTDYQEKNETLEESNTNGMSR